MGPCGPIWAHVDRFLFSCLLKIRGLNYPIKKYIENLTLMQIRSKVL